MNRQQYEEAKRLLFEAGLGQIRETYHHGPYIVRESQAPYLYAVLTKDWPQEAAPHFLRSYGELAIRVNGYLTMNVHNNGECRIEIAISTEDCADYTAQKERAGDEPAPKEVTR